MIINQQDLTEAQKELATKIRAYAQSKKENDPGLPNGMKKKFFLELADLMKEGLLTVEKLNVMLADLDDEERYKLFYLARKITLASDSYYKHKCSVDSHSAQWLKTIYASLGVHLPDLSLAILIVEGLSTEENKKKPYENKKKLDNIPYTHWLENPLSSLAQAHLEHELKGNLKLNKAESANKSLVEVMTEKIEGLGDLERMARSKETTVKLFETLHKVAPKYVSTVVNQFYELYKDKQGCLDLLEEAVKEKPELKEAFSQANAAIASYFVAKKIIAFPELPSYLQHPVLETFESHYSSKEFRNLLEAIQPDENLNEIKFFELMCNSELRWGAIDPAGTHPETFRILSDNIYQRLVPQKKERLISPLVHYQGAEAIFKINKYLNDKPNGYKTDFYTYLREDIRSNGLTVEVLNKHLKRTDKKKLFASFGGQEKSEAAKLMAELVRLANYSNEARRLNSDEIHRLNKTIVEEDGFIARQNAFLKKMVSKVLSDSVEADKSQLGYTIAEEGIAYYKGIALANIKLNEHKQKQAEAIYQQYLIQKALTVAASEALPIFDPQGHVLVQLDLKEDDYKTILKEIGVASNDGNQKEQLKAILGTELTNSTLCNVDIIKHPELLTKFKEKFLEGAKNPERLEQAFVSYLASGERGSVIALQEEMEMHVSLCLRAIEKIIKQGTLLNPEQIKGLKQQINGLVWEKFREAFRESYLYDLNQNTVEINYVALNKKLDEARASKKKVDQKEQPKNRLEKFQKVWIPFFQKLGKSRGSKKKETVPGLAEQCREKLVEVLKKADKIDDAFVKNFDKAKDSTFTSTTATAMDYLCSDASLQTVVRITATENTAHNKKIGADTQAFRLLARNKYESETNKVTPYIGATYEARVPSIADKKAKHSLAVNDVAAKLGHSYDELRKKAAGYQGPMVYNLLTSLRTKAFTTLFDFSNQQRSSAARILKGAHKFNAGQVDNNETEALIYVQNIPVNQHTNELSFKAFDNATVEAALMTDLALLSTFKYYAAAFPPVLRQDLLKTYATTHRRYLDFLHPVGGDGEHYFKDSYAGKLAMANLTQKKKLWQQVAPMEASDDIRTLAVQVLFKMMVNNEHQKKQFGMLAQALSVFIEPMSQAGCKSANERYQAVAGRVEVLHALRNASDSSEKMLQDKFAQVKTSLQDYIAGGCNLYLLDELPKRLVEYKNSYLFIKKNDIQKLYYIKPNGEPEKAEIDNFKLFEEKINVVKNKDGIKLHLSKGQIEDIVTANGGHIPTEKNKIELVQESIDKLYNEINLQGSAKVFSEEDQGGPSKVIRSANSKGGSLLPDEINTNIAESGFLTRLSQKFCKMMQTHHAKLADVFKDLFSRAQPKPEPDAASSSRGPSR